MSESQKNVQTPAAPEEIKKPPRRLAEMKVAQDNAQNNKEEPICIEINSENALKAVVYSEIFGKRGGRRGRR